MAKLLLLTALWSLTFFFENVSAWKITGATGGVNTQTGERPLRTEINQFAKSGAAFDLYIQALGHMQYAQQQAEGDSYFQLAGIHGYPKIPWDDVKGSGSYPGYCMHATTAFPTWHRPYLAVFEQAIWENAQTIAEWYPAERKDEYRRAAKNLRIPYWDWASNPALPDAVTRSWITINRPNGPANVFNPLYNYRFHPGSEGNGFPSSHPMAGYSSTVRWLDRNTGQENQSAATAAMMSNAPTILSMTYQLFSTNTDYTTFSTTFPAGQVNKANNIENIHNAIHNIVGGWGHMQYPEVAAFDPLFWLHHANLDRLFAMWQAVNPNSWMVPTVNAYGSYYEPAGTVDSGSSTLAPFHSDEGYTLWTSDRVRNTRTFGYSYPELPDWRLTQGDLSSYVRQQVNRLYNPSTRRKLRSRKMVRRSDDIATDFSDVSIDFARSEGVNNLDMQWAIRIDIDRYASDSGFAIDFFMGAAPDDIDSWPTASNLIGTHGQFIAQNVTRMTGGGLPDGQLQGEISLTATLAAGVDRGVLSDLTPDAVIPTLQEGLTWRARSPEGYELDLESLTGLTISVSSMEVTPAKSLDQFPVYGEAKWHPEVTQGKPGGATQVLRFAR